MNRPADPWYRIVPTMPTEAIPAVEVVDLTRRFGTVPALDGVSLAIRPGEFFSLLGPSGCGKTTLLRLIAGLDAPDEGIVRLAGTDATGLPAHRRPVNTVFQSYALFPHLSVRDNVAFGLRMKRVPAEEIRRRVEVMMALVEIGTLADRRPSQLSGGQKQRVALARAVVNEPNVLLLDEPLAALDLKLRKQLQIELRNLQRRLGITFVYVTHDQEEALVLSDRIAVLRDGRIEQLGETRALYDQPRTRFVSQFLGACCLLEGSLRERTTEGFLADTLVGVLRVDRPPPDRSSFTLAIRPERLRLMPPRSTATPETNSIAVRIAQRLFVGSETRYELVTASQTLLRAETVNSDAGEGAFAVGQEATVHLPPAALVVLDD